MSKKGREFIKNYEGLRLEPYNDQTGKTITSWKRGATIGYGHLISEDDWPIFKNGISRDEAAKLFDADIELFATKVKDLIAAEVAQHQFDAMVSLAFNIGIGGFSNSSALKIVNDPNAKTGYTSLEAAWKAFRESQGKVNKGLISRRKDEWELYSDADYVRDH